MIRGKRQHQLKSYASMMSVAMACHCDVIEVVIRIQYGEVGDGSSDGDSDYGTVA